jgi:uncharacterized protein YukE
MATIGEGLANIGDGVSQIAKGVGQVSQGLLRTASDAVDAVVNALIRQQSILEDQVRGNIEAIIGQVTSGIWIGAGADAFVQELQTEFLPVSASLDSSIGRMIQGVQSAQNLVEQADKQATQVVDTWAELVDAIF